MQGITTGQLTVYCESERGVIWRSAVHALADDLVAFCSENDAAFNISDMDGC